MFISSIKAPTTIKQLRLFAKIVVDEKIGKENEIILKNNDPLN